MPETECKSISIWMQTDQTKPYQKLKLFYVWNHSLEEMPVSILIIKHKRNDPKKPKRKKCFSLPPSPTSHLNPSSSFSIVIIILSGLCLLFWNLTAPNPFILNSLLQIYNQNVDILYIHLYIWNVQLFNTCFVSLFPLLLLYQSNQLKIKKSKVIFIIA